LRAHPGEAVPALGIGTDFSDAAASAAPSGQSNGEAGSAVSLPQAAFYAGEASPVGNMTRGQPGIDESPQLGESSLSVHAPTSFDLRAAPPEPFGSPLAAPVAFAGQDVYTIGERVAPRASPDRAAGRVDQDGAGSAPVRAAERSPHDADLARVERPATPSAHDGLVSAFTEPGAAWTRRDALPPSGRDSRVSGDRGSSLGGAEPIEPAVQGPQQLHSAGLPWGGGVPGPADQRDRGEGATPTDLGQPDHDRSPAAQIPVVLAQARLTAPPGPFAVGAGAAADRRDAPSQRASFAGASSRGAAPARPATDMDSASATERHDGRSQQGERAAGTAYPPTVHIGRIDVIIESPQPTRQEQRTATAADDLASRLYLRGL
jgi:hypothetical protein